MVVPPLLIGAVAAMLALSAAMGIGYRLGTGTCADDLAAMRSVLKASQTAADAAKIKTTEAQARIDQLAEQLRTAVDSPEVVYLQEAMKSYEPPTPLPPSACADAKWAGMLNSATGARKPAAATTRAKGVADSVTAAANAADGYVSAGAVRDWIVEAVKANRAAVKRDRDWCEFVQQIPGIEPFNCPQ